MLLYDKSLSLSSLIWLASDEYDKKDKPSNCLSATDIAQNSIRKIILASRIKETEVTYDLMDRFAVTLGTSVHTQMEKIFEEPNLTNTLNKLNIPDKLKSTIKINPTNPNKEDYNIYLEKRTEKELDDFIISGKFDKVENGTIIDTKVISTFAYSPEKLENYKIQLSIYRWLNPELITNNKGILQLVFKDFKRFQTNKSSYPSQPLTEYPFILYSLEETELLLRKKIRLLKQYRDVDEKEIPHCTPKELWASDPVFKYYKTGDTSKRATKIFDTLADAKSFQIHNNNTGVIKEVTSKGKACNYCPVFSICSQKDLQQHD